MTFVTKMAALVTLSMLAAVGCAAEPPAEEAANEVETVTQALDQGTSVAFKSKSDLENDGYTCTTTLTWTLCYRNGSPSYSCDPQGRCTTNRSAPPPTGPIKPRPWVSGAVLEATP